MPPAIPAANPSVKAVAADPGESLPFSRPAVPGRSVADFITLTKPRVNLLVLMTTAIGFYLAASAPMDLWRLFHTLLGTWLVASGAAAVNQVLERDIDRRMRRTHDRPLPAGRLQQTEAVVFALALATLGLAELAVGTTVLASVVAFATFISYALLYTPLKTRTSLSTVVGAVPGALPPVIGWAAARGSLSIEAWVLFAIVFFWQMPHVLAVSWMYREDYARGGIRVLPVIEPDGASTARQAISYAAVLIPVSLLPTVIGISGMLYLWSAAAFGALMLGLSIAFARERTRTRSRWLFLATLGYLPILWALLVVNPA